VWAKEQGRTVSLAEVADPFVVLDVARRKKPIARNLEICRMQKRLYLALSDRARGIETDEDPFELRAVLSVLSGGSP
jgi:hypothetical protein